MMQIIPISKSIIPACDVPDIDTYERILNGTADNPRVGGYKIGFQLALKYGLPLIASETRNVTDKPLIYDHQKAGTDIPDTGKGFMDVVKKSGFDAVILFPQSGPVTEYEWIRAAQDVGLGVIVGGEMTHPRFLRTDLRNRDYTQIFEELGIERDLSGFMGFTSPDDIYELAARMGVTNFVVPGNKPDSIKHYKSLVERFVENPVFFAPGLIEQGGEITEAGKVAGERFHAIAGRGIYWNKREKRYNTAEEVEEVALDLTSKL
ncbi:MAG: orotidine 5'-phosphate decarboxylase / HUMPS family protein [archaeon]